MVGTSFPASQLPFLIVVSSSFEYSHVFRKSSRVSGTVVFSVEIGYCQPFDGGVLDVRSGSSATFSVPVSFEGNSVAGGHSGGAIAVEGQVSLDYSICIPGDVWTYEISPVWQE